MDLHAKKTAGLEYPWSEPPAPSGLIEVAEGVHWLRMPLPMALDHINLWLLEGERGWTLVDCGMATETTRNLWRELLGGAAARLAPEQVVATHFHPDHVGLAGWLCREYGLPLSMTAKEHHAATLSKTLDDDAFVEELKGFFLPHGLDAKRMGFLAERGNAYARTVEEIPAEYHRIADGEELELGGNRWRVIVGSGHAPEHAALYCEKLHVLICGDLLLPQITPNISTEWFDQESDHLDDYLASLDRFRELPEDTLVLPSHRLPYRGMHARIREIAGHHEERLQRAVDAMGAESRAAAEFLPVLFDRELEGYQVFFALGEAIAHLDHLVARGQLTVERSPGRVRYRKA